MPILRVTYNSYGQYNLSDFRSKFWPLKIKYFNFVHIHKQQDMCFLNIKGNNKILFLSPSKQHLHFLQILADLNPS